LIPLKKPRLAAELGGGEAEQCRRSVPLCFFKPGKAGRFAYIVLMRCNHRSMLDFVIAWSEKRIRSEAQERR